MRILIAWILGSLVIGYLGRKRRAGFWGTFFFSLLFSPIVGALAWLLAAPSSQEKDKQRRAVKVAIAKQTAAVPKTRQATVATVATAFLVPWLVMVGIFAVAYAFMIPGGTGAADWERGLELSLDMATIGLSGSAGGGAAGLLRVLMSIERLIVLLLLATAVTRVTAALSDARLRQMRTTFDQSLGALEASNRAQQEELTRLRAVVAQASGPATPPPSAASSATATVSH